MAKVIVSDLTNVNNLSGVETLNANFKKLQGEFDKVLYADGSATLRGTLDLNSNRLINLPDAVSSREPVPKSQVQALVADAVAQAQLGVNIEQLVTQLVAAIVAAPLAAAQAAVAAASQAAAAAAASAQAAADIVANIPTIPTIPIPTPFNTYANATTVLANVPAFATLLQGIEDRLTAIGSVAGSNAINYSTSGDTISVALSKLQSRILFIETTPTQDNTSAGDTTLKAGNTAWQSRFSLLESRFTALGTA